MMLDLNTKQFGRLIAFMQSGYFVKQDTSLTQLFKILLDAYPYFDKIEKDQLFTQLFPKEDFNSKKILDLFSKLTLLVEDFLALEYLKNNKSKFHSIKSMAYYEEGDFSNFHKQANKALSKWEDEHNIYSTHEKLLLYQHIHYYPYAEKKEGQQSFLMEASQLTDAVYVLSKLRYHCESLTGRDIYAPTFKPTFKEEVFTIAEQIRIDYPLIDLYLNIFEIYQKPIEEAVFIEILNKFYSLFPTINPFEASIIITLLLNFCGSQYYKKKVEFIDYQFQLHQFGVKHKIYMLYGYLKYTTFINIVTTAVAIKDAEFIETFVKNYLHLLSRPYRSKCKQLAIAFAYFVRGNYNMANRNVLFLEDKSIFFSLRARFLALRCNFEFLLEDNTQKGPFFAHCQNFRTFINKQKDILAEPRRKTYLNHTDILESLAKALNKNYISKQKVIEIAQTINDAPSLVAWQYLQDKLRQLTPKN